MAGAAGSVEDGGADVGGEDIGARIDWPEVVAGSLDAVILFR